MNVPTTWQCPNCGEQHCEEFDVCWKCGTNLVGQRDPEFRITEPVRDLDQALESPSNSQELPVLQLPLVTYFSIPPVLCYSLFTMHKILDSFDSTQMPGFPFSLTDIAVYSIAMVLIWVPGMITVIRAVTYLCVHKHKFSSRAAESKWHNSIYRLPESARRSYPWFVPIYNYSLDAWLIVSIGLIAWRLLQLI